jgi:hypothetical protein
MLAGAGSRRTRHSPCTSSVFVSRSSLTRWAGRSGASLRDFVGWGGAFAFAFAGGPVVHFAGHRRHGNVEAQERQYQR